MNATHLSVEVTEQRTAHGSNDHCAHSLTGSKADAYHGAAQCIGTDTYSCSRPIREVGPCRECSALWNNGVDIAIAPFSGSLFSILLETMFDLELLRELAGEAHYGDVCQCGGC